MQTRSVVGPLAIMAAFLVGHFMISPSCGQDRAKPTLAHQIASAEAAKRAEDDEYEGVDANQPHLVSVLGREVRTRVEDVGGRIIDLLADHNGQVVAAVIEFGGFLGIGTRKIAVAWSALRFNRNGHAVTVDVARDQLRAAPDFNPREPIVVHQASD
jgi:predicted O-methyltransferase YrrM